MPDSLLDFGNITKLAQQNLQNAMHMQQLSLQEEQGQRAAQQLKINQQNATTEHINALGNFLKDENVKFDPNLTGAIVNKISSLAGGPAVNMDSIQVGRQAKIDYAHGIMTGDLNLADQGLKGYAVAATPDQLDNLIKTTVQYPKLNEELLALRQKREEDASKFEALQENNARVSIGRPLYTAMSSSLREQMKVTETKDFRMMESLYDKAKSSGGNVAELLGSKSIPGVDKKNISALLNGNFGEMARRVGDRLDTLAESIQQDQKMLDDADHGVPLPKDMTKAILRARIETNSVARGAMTSMKEWYEEPFDKQKRAAAMGAARTIEDQRLKIEDLDKNTHADTIKIQQETLAFHQKQQQDKDEQASAEAMAKAAYSALPAKRQTPQEAEKIYQSVFEKTGRHVDTDTIMKGNINHNKPMVDLQVNTAEKASDAAAKDFIKVASERYDQLQSVPQVLSNIEQAKALVPAAKGFMGPGGEPLLEAAKFLNNRMGANINVEGVKSVEELRSRLFYGVMDNLKKMDSNPTKQQMDILQQAIGSIGTDPNALPRVLDAFGQNLRTKVELHNKQVASAESRGVRFPFDAKIELPGKESGKPSSPSNRKPLQPSIPSDERVSTYGNRPDGTPKGAGYFGEIPSPVRPGEFSTELTIGVNLGGKETNIPLITPNLSRSEIEMVMRGRESKEIIGKAVEHAKSRMKQGKSPYAEGNEVRGLPAWEPNEFEKFYGTLRKGDTYTGPDGKQRTKR